MGGSSVFAEDVTSLMNKIMGLENKMRTLERQVYRGEVPTPKQIPRSQAPAAVFNTSGRTMSSAEVQTLEKEVQRLTSSLEEISHKIDLQAQEMRALKNDLEFRISQLESFKEGALKGEGAASQTPKKGSLNAAPLVLPDKEKGGLKTPDSGQKKTILLQEGKGEGSSPTLEKPSSQKTSSAAEGKVAKGLDKKREESSLKEEGMEIAIEDQYKASLDLLKKKEYGAALKGFESFLSNHKDHELSGNAQYWLGEAHFAMNNYSKASVAFLTAYKDYPNNTKRAESLLKLGQSLGKLGKNKEACATFQKLLTDFPNAPNAVRSMAQTENVNNGCAS